MTGCAGIHIPAHLFLFIESLFLVLSKNGNNSRNFAIFASGFEKQVFDKTNRDVAQLVAHYVRDVGVGRSSRLIPTDGRTVSKPIWL